MPMNLEMDTSVFSNQCKVRKCFQCQNDTEFYCNTCKHGLCLACKEKHVIDLDTIYHDVVIYREKYQCIPKQEICEKHPDRIIRRYCNSCKLPVCFKCRDHLKHKLQDVISAYKTFRQQHRETIHSIRSETLYNSFFFLERIKTDMKSVHTEIFNNQPNMPNKAIRLKNLIDTVICEAKFGYTTYLHRFQKLKMAIYEGHVIIEKYEHLSEQSANKAIRFLLFFKKTNIKKTPRLTQHSLLSVTDEINIKLLSEIQIIETVKIQVRNESPLHLKSKPVFNTHVTVAGVNSVNHIYHLTSDRFWISDDRNLILTNTDGDTLHHLSDIFSYYSGVHTVNDTFDLIYIGKNKHINKLSNDNQTNTILIKTPKSWDPQCVYFSPLNEDLLVGMWNTETFMEGKVTRYDSTGQSIQTIQYNAEENLYTFPRYITENRNGDGIVCDWYRAVVVTDRGGSYRFSYKRQRPPSELPMTPYGISLFITFVNANNMDKLKFSTQCKERQCFQCQGDTEFYCNTCKYGPCLQCKERHFIDLDTIYHDVVIYREKFLTSWRHQDLAHNVKYYSVSSVRDTQNSTVTRVNMICVYRGHLIDLDNIYHDVMTTLQNKRPVRDIQTKTWTFSVFCVSYLFVTNVQNTNITKE
ncbi:uncharacterized protein LOC134281724 [Saccostrea cucullata]|uniref:uncharacterized protein LOC134281724 n=1 Tax=Saccostrea cuccullata TaxID=36930 RepID=UPI002ED43425